MHAQLILMSLFHFMILLVQFYSSSKNYTLVLFFMFCLNLCVDKRTGPDAVQYIVNHASVQVIFCVPQTLSIVSFTSLVNIAYKFYSYFLCFVMFLAVFKSLFRKLNSLWYFTSLTFLFNLQLLSFVSNIPSVRLMVVCAGTYYKI